MKTYVTSFGVLLALSAVALSQPPSFPQSPSDFDSLRNQVMSRHFGPAARADLRLDAVPSLLTEKEALDKQIWKEWGVAVAPVPQMLAIHCRALKPGAGLLIEAVRPGSPAEKAGLAAGQILAGVEDEWILSADDLPRLSEPQTLAILVAGQLQQVTIEPAAALQSAGPATTKLRSLSPQASAFSTAEKSRGSQAISMAYANGIFDIEASYATAKGEKKVHLNGTRQQIDKLMADLPESLQQAITSRLQMVPTTGPSIDPPTFIDPLSKNEIPPFPEQRS